MSEQDADVNATVAAPAVPQEPATPDSSPDENNSPEVADPVLAALSTDDDKPSKPEAKTEKADEPSKEETTPEDKPLDEAPDEPKAEKSKNRFQELANKNKEYEQALQDPEFLKQQLAQLSTQEHELTIEEQLLNEVNPDTGDYYTPAEAQRAARLSSLQSQRSNTTIQSNQIAIDMDASRVINDFPVFNPTSPEYKPERAALAAQLLEGYLIRDPNIPEVDPQTGQPTGRGQVVGATASPYLLYQSLAGNYQEAVTEGQVKGQKATERMLANADVSSSAAPPKTKVDPIMAVLDSDD